jgi:hypothetical protein
MTKKETDSFFNISGKLIFSQNQSGHGLTGRTADYGPANVKKER